MFSVTIGKSPVFTISCGSPLSISSSEPGCSLTRLPRALPRASPLPAMTYSHCSAHACSLSLPSLVESPGAIVIIAACEVPVACSGSKSSRLRVFQCFMVVTRSDDVLRNREQPEHGGRDRETQHG